MIFNAILIFVLVTTILYILFYAYMIKKGEDLNIVEDQFLSRHIETLYRTMLLSGVLFLFYFVIKDLDEYLYLNSFKFSEYIYATIAIFIPTLCFLLFLTRNTIRYSGFTFKTLYFLLPSSCLIGSIALYHINIIWDTSPTITSIENIEVRAEEYSYRSKYNSYYLYINKPNNKSLNFKEREIDLDKYQFLSKKKSAEFNVRQGYFGASYFWINQEFKEVE